MMFSMILQSGYISPNFWNHVPSSQPSICYVLLQFNHTNHTKQKWMFLCSTWQPDPEAEVILLHSSLRLSAQFALWKWMKQLPNFTHLDVRLSPFYWHSPSGLEGKLKFANNPKKLPPSYAGFKSGQDIRKREYCCSLQMLLIHLTSSLDALVMFEVMGQ